MAQHVRIDRAANGVALVVVARADIGNASSPAMLGEIRDAFTELSSDNEVRAIVLSAEGKHFSVGADFGFLKDITAMPASEIKGTVYANFQGAAKAIYRCAKPTLALVQGAAVTVGCELALACDFRIAADNVRFQESWIKLGIMPPLGGVFLLPRIIGMGRAMEMCMLGKQVGGEEALRIGLVSELVAPDQLPVRGLEFARELTALPPMAYATVKQSLQRGLESSMEAEWQANLSNQALLLGSEDFREGLTAVTGKRAPQFAGR
ncbi:enoyl-CoA hydratase/isomerase family protein [Novosphingobium sp.]|uniref:enoyl-CoA hydratase/isomerase family protein n=1 Tax=Novosphingobium sp. TaxID=1874826 RepID=UPI0025F7D91C|nr:enoyl-CoA hydratase/isomerase family protein [Novosphingobium sp.]